MTLNSSLYVLLCPPLYAYHYLRKFQLTSIIQLAFLQPFQHHILPHLQSLLHRVFTVNLLRGISGLKPASCFLCTVNKAQTFHEAREASGSILWLFAMPFTHQAPAGLRLAVQRCSLLWFSRTRYKLPMKHGEYHCSYLIICPFSSNAP